MAARGRKSGIILIVLALVVILGAAAIYFLVIRGMPDLASTVDAQPTEEAQPQAMGQIVISSQNIQRGSELSEDVLVTIPYPQEEISAGVFFTDLDEVVGLRAREDIAARVPITQAMLVGEEDVLAKNPSFDIPSGFTAVSMPMSSLTSASYRVLAGDHVMVIGCLTLVDLDTDFQTTTPNGVAPVIAPYTPVEGPATTTITVQGTEGGSPPRGRVEMDTGLGLPVYVIPGEQNQRPRLVCQTMIQDAVVLGVGEYEEPEPIVQAEPVDVNLPDANQPAGGQETPVEPVEEEPPDTELTLVMSPQDAVSLNYMMLSGVKLSMALRNPTDADPMTTQAVTLQFLMDQKVIPLPAKLPYGIQSDILMFPDEAVPQADAVE